MNARTSCAPSAVLSPLQLTCGTSVHARIPLPIRLHVRRKASREHPGNGCCGALGSRGALAWCLAKVAGARAALTRRARRPQHGSNSMRAWLDGGGRHPGSSPETAAAMPFDRSAPSPRVWPRSQRSVLPAAPWKRCPKWLVIISYHPSLKSELEAQRGYEPLPQRVRHSADLSCCP